MFYNSFIGLYPRLNLQIYPSHGGGIGLCMGFKYTDFIQMSMPSMGLFISVSFLVLTCV
jgi:hypothetical protein